MAAPCFGFSVGDFIAGVQLLAQIAAALKSSSKAAAECQSIIAELELLQHLLCRVQDLRYSASDPIAAQRLQICAVNCNGAIARFAARVQTYNSFLSGEEDARKVKQWFRKAPRKVRWALAMREDVENLKASILPQFAAIGVHLQLEMLEVVSRMQSREEDTARAAVVARLERAQCFEEQADAGASNTLLNTRRPDDSKTSVQSQPRGQMERLQHTSIRHSLDGENVELYLLVDAFEHGLLMIVCFLRVMHHFIKILAAMPRYPSWLLDTNIRLIDPLGRSLSLPYEHFRSWDVLTARLRVAFRGCSGELKVQRGNFQIYSFANGEESWDELSWEQAIVPGAKVAMALLVTGNTFGFGACPSCGAREFGEDKLGWQICKTCLTRSKANVLISSQEQSDDDCEAPTESLLETSESWQDPVLSSTDWNAQIDEEEGCQVQDFKMIQWCAWPCPYCHEIYTIEREQLNHMSEVHAYEMSCMGIGNVGKSVGTPPEADTSAGAERD